MIESIVKYLLKIRKTKWIWKNKIKTLLIQKGVSKNIFEDFLDEFEYDDEFDNALKMGIKKLNLLSNEEDNFKKSKRL
ncbi:regulatory protein RecX-like protein [Parvimonas sp. oral taxon 393 str. F0440]|nr:regulatory protein RecX-like protein [Parvimonas sp. oral taxon 393 str. F0440]